MKLLVPITAVLGAAVAVVAFMAGAVAYSEQTWPFGAGYEFVDMVQQKLSRRLAQTLDEYTKTELSSGHHELVIERWPMPFRDWGPTGPFVVLGQSEFIVASRPGEIFHVKLDGPKATHVSMGKIEVNENDNVGAGLKGFLLLSPDTLLVTRVTYHEGRGCYLYQLLELSLDVAQKKVAQRRQILEVQPCIKPQLHIDLSEAGGRIVKFADGQVLLSTGHFGLRLGGQHGKLLVVNLKTGATIDYAKGMRNAQGIYFDAKTKQIFETEHGPRGGDEVNLVRQGIDYGWPKVSYGTSYDGPEEPDQPGDLRGAHEGFEQPLITFIPSIGIGNLIRYPADAKEFPLWQNDLLVASLREQTLYRMRYLDGRIVFAEPIKLDERIRDIAMLPDGAVALKTDTPRLIIISHRRKP